MRVVVIGSGLMGLTTAYFLRKHGAEVVVIDRRDASGRETSFANGGMLHASQASPWNAPGILWVALRMMTNEDSPLLVRSHAIPRMLGWGIGFIRQSRADRFALNTLRNARLARYSLAVMQQIRSSESLAYDYAGRGTLTIYRTQKAFDAAAALIDGTDGNSAPVNRLDREAVVALEPALEPIAGSIAGGIHYPDDESGDAFKFCRELQRICARDGVEFHFNTLVRKLAREDDRLGSADTDARRFRADKFVLAAGSYSPLLSRGIGLRLPVQPVKGYSITVPSGTWERPPAVPVIDDHWHAAVCPLGDRMRVAGTAEFAGYDTRLTKKRLDNLVRLLTTLYPAFEAHLNPSTIDRWTGLRPMTIDGVGIMGRTEIPNLFVNTGHGHLGWTMAAAAGRCVAEEVVGVQSEFDLRDYRLENRRRF